jgi:hypothetical protein
VTRAFSTFEQRAEVLTTAGGIAGIDAICREDCNRVQGVTSFRYMMLFRLSVGSSKEVIHVGRSVRGNPAKMEDICTGGLKVSIKSLLCSAMQASTKDASDSISNPNGAEAWFRIL